jgi:hypothetical protein
MHKIILFLLALTLCGCGMLDGYGRKDFTTGYTTVRFNAPDASAMNLSDRLTNFADISAATMGGGILVYVISVDSKTLVTNFPLADEFDTREYVLPNGTYRVFAFGFTTTELGYNGVVKCGLGNLGSDVSLTGNTQTISINLSNTNCSNDRFSSGGGSSYYDSFNNQPYKLKVFTCNSQGVGTNLDCQNQTSPGAISYFKIEIPIFIVDDGGFRLIGAASSRCYTGNTQGVSTELPLPVGNFGQSDYGLPVAIRGFTASDCKSGFVGSYRFYQGIANVSQVKTVDSNDTPTVSLPVGTLSARIKLYEGAVNLFLRDNFSTMSSLGIN